MQQKSLRNLLLESEFFSIFRRNSTEEYWNSCGRNRKKIVNDYEKHKFIRKVKIDMN